MSTTYKFFVEAFYAGKWYNIDYLTQGTDGCLNHQYLSKISRSFLGLLEPLIPSGHCLNFEELAETSQTLLLEETKEEHEDYDILPHTLNLQEETEMIRRMERQAEIVHALGLLDDIEGET